MNMSQNAGNVKGGASFFLKPGKCLMWRRENHERVPERRHVKGCAFFCAKTREVSKVAPGEPRHSCK